jgi:hypothetical protein
MVVIELFSPGDHEPVIPFNDVTIRGERLSPAQIGAMGSNNGAG